MLGKITKFRDDVGVGVIEAEDGRKYRFARSAIYNAAPKMVGLEVDFLVAASRPTEIIVMSGSPWTAFAGAIPEFGA
jgi:hypothetical protein